LKKTILKILILLLISLNLNAQINGKFKHNICEFGPNCFVYQFNENGTFEYQYHQDILGSGTLTGNYIKVGDTLKLIPDKVLYSPKSKIIEKEYNISDSTKIKIKIQRLAKIGETDLDSLQWYVSINKGKYLPTDKNGNLTIVKTKIEEIKIKDTWQVELGTKLWQITDSIFRPKTNWNLIEIYLSENDEGENLAIIDWMTKIFVLKGRRLYPLTFEPEVGFLGKGKTYYRKIK
jgi:hypothetical protein